LGWVEGRNLQIDLRWGEGNAEALRKEVADLVASAPDVILASGPVSQRLLQSTRTLPIVFVIVPDPVGAGLVESLSKPGGNATGFMQFEYSLCAKWPELLKEITPGLKRAAVLRDPADANGIGQFAVIQSVAPALGIEAVPINMRSISEVEQAVANFARPGAGGLVVPAGPLMAYHRKLIFDLAARHKLPAIYNSRQFTDDGGLISYGADFPDQYRRAASYVDRILRGEKAADLPVQAPTKYELVINQRTARAHGITVPPTLLARADDVIE
jgi:putative ABC transport system substrate-binding protein